MPRKCSVGECSSRYLTNPEKVTVYGFPSNKEECYKWVKALPNTIKEPTRYMGVCANHWHVGFPKVKVKGSERHRDPPPVFEGIPKSFCPQTLVSPPRDIKKRNVDIDSRNSATNHNIEVEDTDVIKSWDNLIVFLSRSTIYHKC